MQALEGTAVVRSLDELAEALPERIVRLSQLFFRRSTVGVSRVEAGVLGAVADRPRRITELAAREGLTQPAISRLVDRLQERGWVVRQADPGDRRVVLVALTVPGGGVLDRLRVEYRSLLHEEMASLADADVHTLARAIEVLDELIARVQDRDPPEEAHDAGSDPGQEA
jgi:DNA-binding MarR family transcriptional regulator